MGVDIAPVLEFLPCPTPKAWVDTAVQHLDVLLIDHANCEKKAAASAMALLNRHTDQPVLLNKMSRLAREELRHFEQVLKIMARRHIDYVPLTAARYAASLRRLVRAEEPSRLVDTLLIGALIEARSCERFAALIPALDVELADFYESLLKSEARHFMDYLSLAEGLTTKEEVAQRLETLRVLEQSLIEGADNEFRFHSGVPATTAALTADIELLEAQA
ncbi:tRNA-(ms[2]io[6]A)-hydroxylase [Luminiphilus syltensis]|uniref:tRNA-(ms[2]io[6]A)-hydroxylase n=1 Tax=Luminiphilus syltensis TaxID=1341119 RepID=UPI0002E03F02|nr:tRNA isopentenyl-2-thiomethyl-A-37 hydroxylase MiaE [Luminiphilus syltensis]